MGEARWFCHTIDCPPSAYLSGFVHPDFKLSPIRIPPSVAAFQSRFPRPLTTSIRPRLHVQQHERMRNVPRLIVLVHTRRRPEALLKLLVTCTPLQVAPPPPRKRIQMLLLYGVTLLPIPTTQHPRDWRQRSRPFPVRKRAPRLPPPLQIAPSSPLAHHRSL
jgi:hypothetical protein